MGSNMAMRRMNQLAEMKMSQMAYTILIGYPLDAG
jgi:hypothetical protein